MVRLQTIVHEGSGLFPAGKEQRQDSRSLLPTKNGGSSFSCSACQFSPSEFKSERNIYVMIGAFKRSDGAGDPEYHRI